MNDIFKKLRNILSILFLAGFAQLGAVAATVDTVCGDTTVCEPAEVVSWSDMMRTEIDRLLESPMFERSQVAVYVYDLDGDSVLYDFGGRQLMRPASVMKLFTACTALKELGAGHLFKTELFYNGVVSDSILNGDIYIKGGFDPLFGREDMDSFIDKISRAGICGINGRIYADVSFKDTLKWGEGWCWDDKETTLTPLLYEGKDVFMDRFMRRLTEAGISHPAMYSRRCVGESGNMLLDARAHTVEQMLDHMMKASDNLFAESLFYQLGADKKAPYARAKRSVEKVNGFIRTLGFDPGNYTVADGSGLSLYNYVTPKLVTALLRYAWQHKKIYNSLYPTLPVSGIDGTLKNRMKYTPAEGMICAKTGTLRRVSTLAGYTQNSEGKNLAFCIFNQGILNSAEGRNFQDKVCNVLVK